MFEVLLGDCREMMATLEAESVHSIVTDPPYELGFMGKSWDSTGIAYDPEVWRQAMRVLKPGGHLLAFSGSRTYHRMACAIEDAGFEIRDQIMWLYGSGFPKSLNVAKAIESGGGKPENIRRMQMGDGYEPSGRGRVNYDHGSGSAMGSGPAEWAPATPEAREWSGWGTALKPAHEPIVLARKPFKGTVAQNVLAHGTGAMNIDGCRVGTDSTIVQRSGPSAELGYRGHGSMPSTTGSPSGRWPANVMHDGSDEVVGAFPDAGGGNGKPIHAGAFGKSGIYGVAKGATSASYADSGSAARFFYCPKASKSDREYGLSRASGGRANNHPTVKPTELMRYLCRLVTPEGGIVLDPFTGSGSTGRGAMLEGFRFLGVEMDPGYREIALARIQAAAERRTHGDS